MTVRSVVGDRYGLWLVRRVCEAIMYYHPCKSLTNFTLLAGSVILLAGCVVPMPAEFPQTLETKIPENRAAFLESEQVSKADVVAELGETRWTFANDSKWVYPMRSYRTTSWDICFLLPIPWSDFQCGAMTAGNIKYRLLVIEYDNDDAVTNWSMTSALANSCIDNGVCLYGDGIFALASENADSLAKEFNLLNERCVFYMYATLPRALNVLSVSMDNELIGYLGGSSNFLHWTAESGPHTVSALPANSWAVASEDTEVFEVNCNAGDIFILHKDRSSGRHLPPELVPYDRDGQKAIEKRRLLLSSKKPPTK